MDTSLYYKKKPVLHEFYKYLLNGYITVLQKCKSLSYGVFVLTKSNFFVLTKSNTKSIIKTMIVEWDSNKNLLNLKKHGISFDTAALVFADKNYLELYDKEHSFGNFGEDRFIILGKVNKVLFVVITHKQDSVRIISARLATKCEEEIYYGNS